MSNAIKCLYCDHPYMRPCADMTAAVACQNYAWKQAHSTGPGVAIAAPVVAPQPAPAPVALPTPEERPLTSVADMINAMFAGKK